MGLTSYRAAAPRVKPCGYLESREARAPPRDGAYVAIASRLGKGAAHFYPACAESPVLRKSPDFEGFSAPLAPGAPGPARDILRGTMTEADPPGRPPPHGFGGRVASSLR